MFRQTQGDTYVATIEERYGTDLNARGDTLLRNLLEQRGFDSLTQLLTAYHGRAASLARKRRVFLSFHAEDKRQIQGLRLMARNPRLELDFYDASVRSPVNSENAGYIRRVIRRKISQSSVVMCLIGNGTAWRDWVRWELSAGYDSRKGLCGVRLKHSRGRTPDLLARLGAPIARWSTMGIIAAIECAAARRS